ncbi:MAG: hypothetical protein PHH13_05375 [Candidatus Peribacteraceae bacterium]|nr:hypothetical protein [Candidatus Peribacteraceae bacterium]
MQFPLLRCRSRPGFLLLDVLLGISVFAIITGAVGYGILYSQRVGIQSGDRMRAVTIAANALEGARAIRDEDFSLLTAGVHGVEIGSTGRFTFAGSGTMTADGFRTTVTVERLETDRAIVTAVTTWSFGVERTGTASLIVELTNWRQEKEIGNWASPSLDGSFISEDPLEFNAIAVKGDYAFVTSETDHGGVGLYVFDITDTSQPQRVADGFSLDAAGKQLVVAGTTLYILATSPSAEIRVYNISSPETLSTDDLLGSFNLPGEGLGRSLALFGSTLFVTSGEDAAVDQLYSLSVSNPTQITLLDSVHDDGGYFDISLHNGYAYIASSEDVSELVVADVYTPSDLRVAAGSGYNLTDTPDGLAVAAFGTSALLGRSVGDTTEELVLFDIADNPVPSPPPGPWYHNIGGNVTALDTDPTGRYAFLATDKDEKQFQVVDLWKFVAGLPPEAAYKSTTTGVGRGVKYDILRDRTYFTTTNAFIIYKPAP